MLMVWGLKTPGHQRGFSPKSQAFSTLSHFDLPRVFRANGRAAIKRTLRCCSPALVFLATV
jgi:hypothetical protein